MDNVIYISAFAFAAAITILVIKSSKAIHDKCIVNIEGKEILVKFGFINMLLPKPIKMRYEDKELIILSDAYPALAEARNTFRRTFVFFAAACVYAASSFKGILYDLLFVKHDAFGVLVMAACIYMMWAAVFLMPLAHFRKCTELSCEFYNKQK